MDDLSECILDRHFIVQLRVIGNVYKNKIKKSDYILSQQWIKHFRQAPGQQKYARNCLMLLMYGQLKEMCRLGKPFTDMENSKRNLDDILCEYNGKMDDDNNTNNNNNNNNNNDDDDGDDDVDDDDDDDELIYNKNVGIPNIKPKLKNLSLIKDLSEDKLKTLRDIDKSHNPQTSPKDDKNPNINLPKKIPKEMQIFDYPKIEGNNQKLMANIWQSVSQAINRLKTWTGPDDQINFIAICLQHLTTPEMRENISILDRRFERILNYIAQHACERHEKNVMILFEQLSKQQHKLFLANKEYNRRLQHYTINTQDHQHKFHKDFLKEREQLLWQQEAIANGISALVACNHYSNQHSLVLEGELKQKSMGIETKDSNAITSSIINSEDHQQINGSNQLKGTCSYCQGQSSQMF